MPLHQNIRGWPGDVYGQYSLYDNLWIYTGGGLFIAPRSGWYLITGCGGGAGGGGAGASTGGASGGGGGARLYRAPIWLNEGEAFLVTIGQKGTGGVSAANGTDGTATSLGSVLILGGGIKGLQGASGAIQGGAAGVITGTRTGGIMKQAYTTGSGATTQPANCTTAQAGGSSTTGGGATSGAGGGYGFAESGNIMDILLYGADGTPGAARPIGNNAGIAGVGYGVGGSGAYSTSTNQNGGDGTPGILFIEMAA